jgi:3-hydroxyacyl-[acyl-carrier-protein] dehydratase
MSQLSEAIRASALSPFRGAGTDTVERDHLFGPDFPGFEGHFPGFPILPGVAQIQAAFCLAEDCRGTALRLAGVESAKFLIQIRPEERVTVQIREKRRGDRLLLDARLTREGELAASFTLSVEEEP